MVDWVIGFNLYVITRDRLGKKSMIIFCAPHVLVFYDECIDLHSPFPEIEKIDAAILDEGAKRTVHNITKKNPNPN
jgi:hypothetical protein